MVSTINNLKPIPSPEGKERKKESKGGRERKKRERRNEEEIRY